MHRQVTVISSLVWYRVGKAEALLAPRRLGTVLIISCLQQNVLPAEGFLCQLLQLLLVHEEIDVNAGRSHAPHRR